jgi:hypothetical protein
MPPVFLSLEKKQPILAEFLACAYLTYFHQIGYIIFIIPL